MLIPNDDLLTLIRETAFRSTPVSAAQVQFTLTALQHSAVEASSSSAVSKSLQNLVYQQRAALTSEARSRLDGVALLGLDTMLCDAIAWRHRNHDCILVHVGLLQLIRFYTEMQLVMDLLKDENVSIDIGGDPTQIGVAASLACHAMLVAAMDTGHQLISLSPLLGDVAIQRSNYGYGAAALFLVLHELGHHALGHVTGGYKSERMATETRIAEPLDKTRQEEMDADAFALQCFAQEVRAPVISSVIFAFGPFAFLETFRGRMDVHHPLTVNRIAAVSACLSFDGEPELQRVTDSIVDAHVARFLKLESDRTRSGGDLSSSIREHMPIEIAYRVLDQIGRWVRDQRGTLDF